MAGVWEETPIMDPEPDEEDVPQQQQDNQEEPPLQSQINILMNPFQQLLGIQSELISKIMTQKVKLAPYDGKTTNPEAWLKSANLIMQKYKPDIADLNAALMEALKGNASLWLSSIIDDNLTWERFQLLFAHKFCRKDTPAATVYRLVSEYFREDIEEKLTEHYPRIRNAFRNRTTDQCADLLIAAVAGRADPEMRKWIFKEETPDELAIFQELASIKATKPRTSTTTTPQKGPIPSNSGYNRKFEGDDPNTHKHQRMDPKRQRNVRGETNPRYCPRCKLNNHSWAYCRFNPNKMKQQTPQDGSTFRRPDQHSGTAQAPPNQHQRHGGFKGGQNPRFQGPRNQTPQQQRRVDFCSSNPTGELTHQVMCPLWPLHIVLMYLIALCPLWFVACQIASKAATWGVQFSSSELETLFMYKKQQLGVKIDQLTQDDLDNRVIRALVDHPDIASVSPQELVFKKEPDGWSSAFNVSGDFLGYTSIKLCMSEKQDPQQKCVKESDPIPVTVLRKPAVIDKIFTYSVIILVSIIFINFGCALDLNSLKQAVIKPVGPIIGLISHFLFLPLLSYGLGELLFPEHRALRLGLFFTGISPAGGASNIWTYSLGGNLNLSVTMTAISTLASFGLIPLWVFTLGQAIFKDGPIGVPYSKIVTSAVGLVVPLAIGYVIQIYCKRVSNIMVRFLKPFSALLIVFIVLFATITNFYLFKLFTWKIMVAGIGLPFLGYLSGLLLSTILKQKPEDVMAISIETGVQNTGIAIFLLKFCLPQPAADLTTVAPVAVALMTPLPLLLLLVWKRCHGGSNTKKEILVEEGHPRTPPLLSTKY